MFVSPGFPAGDKCTSYLHCDAIARSLNFVINDLTFQVKAVDLSSYASRSLYISSDTADSDDYYMLATCSFGPCCLRSPSRPAIFSLHQGCTMSLEDRQVLVDIYEKLRGESHSILNCVIILVSISQENVHSHFRLSLISSIVLLCRCCSSKFPSSNHFSNTFLHIGHSESIIEYPQESLFLPLRIWCCLNVPS